MKDISVIAIAAILFFAYTCPIIAQGPPLTPELKQWEPVLGKWTHELEERESPSAEWKKGSETWEMQSGGFFVEIHGTGELGGEEYSWIEVFGYDPLQGSYVSSFFNSGGRRGNVTSMGWTGSTLRVNYTHVTGDRELHAGRVTWEHSSDFSSVTGTFETFSDGKWWHSRTLTGTKVD